MHYIRLALVCVSLLILSGCQLWWPKTSPRATSATTDQIAPPPPPMIPLPTSVELPYVMYDDGGVSGMLIGCNDSLVSVPVAVPWSITNWQGLLSWMYLELLAQTNKWSLETALPPTGMTLQSLTTTATGAHVAFNGTLLLWWACDAPRVSEQLKKVVSQFPQFTTIKISMNGTWIDEFMSTK